MVSLASSTPSLNLGGRKVEFCLGTQRRRWKGKGSGAGKRCSIRIHHKHVGVEVERGRGEGGKERRGEEETGNSMLCKVKLEHQAYYIT